MIRLKSISWSLQVWHACIIVVCLPLLMTGAYHLHKRAILSSADLELSMELNTVLEQWVALPRRTSNNLPQVSDSGRWFIVWGTRGNYFEKSPDAPDLAEPDNLPVSPHYTWIDGYRVLYHYGPRKNTLYAVGMPADPILDELLLHKNLAITLGVLFGLIAIYGGYNTTKKALQPLNTIREKAIEINSGRYDQRIDVTNLQAELVELCEVLNGAFEHIDHTIDIQRKFTSDASHELRTPISILILELESALRTERTQEEYQERISNCLIAAQRLKKLANSLLEINQLESGQSELKKATVDLHSIAHTACDHLSSKAADKELRIINKITHANLLCDSAKLERVFTNLLSNAIAHTSTNDEITLRSIDHENNIEVEVSDTGEGIPKESLPYVFDRFYRADQARTSTQNRSGLGLSICQSIIHAHGGDIHISSELKVGTTVSFTLPKH